MELAGLPDFQFIQDRIPATAGHANLDLFGYPAASRPDEKRCHSGCIRLPCRDGR